LYGVREEAADAATARAAAVREKDQERERDSLGLLKNKLPLSTLVHNPRSENLDLLQTPSSPFTGCHPSFCCELEEEISGLLVQYSLFVEIR
jgi:hypothetical protein